jgi:hypothetical protein
LKRALAVTVVILASVTAPAAYAQSADSRARAKEAYDKGVEAHTRGDLQRAAEEFARADVLAPSAVALQAALDDAIDADDPALGSELVERSAREKSPPPALVKSVQNAKTKFAGRAGRVHVQCPAGSTCLATIDGAAIESTKPAWARTGQHTVVVQVDGDAQTKLVRVEADQTAEVVGTKKDGGEAKTAPPPPEPVKKDEPEKPTTNAHDMRNGLPPIVFYAGIGLTVALGGLSTFFAVTTSSKHDEFESSGCPRANNTGCQDLKDQGQIGQTLTNAGFITTGVAAVATAIIGAAFTDWKGPVMGVIPGGATVALGRPF